MKAWAMAKAMLHLLATPVTSAVFPSSNFGMQTLLLHDCKEGEAFNQSNEQAEEAAEKVLFSEEAQTKVCATRLDQQFAAPVAQTSVCAFGSRTDAKIRSMPRTILLAAALSACSALAADNYTGPKPPKPDLHYLMHGSNLVPTEIKEAKEEKKGAETVYTIAGATSSAKTPLPEPRFILDAQSIAPEHMELFKVDARDNLREVTLTAKRKKGGNRPLHMTVFPLGGK